MQTLWRAIEAAGPVEQAAFGMLAFFLSIIALRGLYLVFSKDADMTVALLIGRAVVGLFVLIVFLKGALIILYAPIPGW